MSQISSINYFTPREFLNSSLFPTYSIHVQNLLSALTELLNRTTIQYIIKVRKDGSIVISAEKEKEKNLATIMIYQKHIRLLVLNQIDERIDSVDQLDNRIAETILEKYQSISSAKKQISVYLDTNLIEMLEEKARLENKKLNDLVIDSIKSDQVQTNNHFTFLNDSDSDDKLFKKLQYAMMVDEKSASELIEISLNQYFIEPFVNEVHIKNYLFLLDKLIVERKVFNDRDSTKKNSHVDITSKEHAFLYLLSFDDLVMEYVNDGKFISFEEGVKIQIPSEIDALLWKTGENFLYLVLDSFANYPLDVDEILSGGSFFIECMSQEYNSRVEDVKVLSIGEMIKNGRLQLRTPDWYREILKYSKTNETNDYRVLNIEEFLDSETFKAYSSNIKRMLYSMISKFIEYKMINCDIYQREYNVLSFRPKDKPEERLCVICIYPTYIRLSITYSNDDYYHYNLDLDGKDESIVQTLIKRYNLSQSSLDSYNGVALV